ncbi:unnamed protein product [Chironomus riparius]|uniref:Uncharacterized protein n=1 Tax=Chironomus riparius TaxID=315576 RepID=A0A9N9RQ11_9DIPT|nr:unnamed protein product [Chironomus riparius]
MFFQNLSKRKILLLIINALISILMISCVIFLYYYLPASHQKTFTVEKENSVHITKSYYGNANNNNNGMNSLSNGFVNSNVRISSGRRPTPIDRTYSSGLNSYSSLSSSSSSGSQEEAIDDTIYIDNDNYGDESYDNSGNFANEKPATAPVTIIERPVERNQMTQSDDDLYYENYDDTDDEDIDIVSSGNGKIIVNIRKPLPIRTTHKMRTTTTTTSTTEQPEPMQPVVENVYSVSSEIVSNLKNQYSVEDIKQINKADRSSSSSDGEYDKEDGPDLDEWTTETDAKGKRLIGNNKSLVERSRQLLLCESARTGELCRMLFKGTVG